MLDGVEDPFNFGQAVRSLYAAGVTGLVLPPRNWTTATDVVTRASAGTTELMPMAIADNTEKAAKFFQKQGLKIACTTDSGATDLYQADLTQPMFLLIGGEKRGITRSFLSQAELKLRIPYKRPFAYALGVTASVAILSFERMRQLTPIISPDS
jgi:23S rRNA (guanosine2251-2'-O)-methyltransferase